MRLEIPLYIALFGYNLPFIIYSKRWVYIRADDTRLNLLINQINPWTIILFSNFNPWAVSGYFCWQCHVLFGRELFLSFSLFYVIVLFCYSKCFNWWMKYLWFHSLFHITFLFHIYFANAILNSSVLFSSLLSLSIFHCFCMFTVTLLAYQSLCFILTPSIFTASAELRPFASLSFAASASTTALTRIWISD